MDSLMRIVPMRSIGGGSWRAHPKRQAIDDLLVMTVESIAAERLELGDVRLGVRNELFDVLDLVWPLLHNSEQLGLWHLNIVATCMTACARAQEG